MITPEQFLKQIKVSDKIVIGKRYKVLDTEKQYRKTLSELLADFQKALNESN